MLLINALSEATLQNVQNETYLQKVLQCYSGRQATIPNFMTKSFNRS